MMNDDGKSDRSVVPEKLPNKADNHAEEVEEERDRAKGNPAKRDKPWTLSQPGLPSALERVGQAARQDKKLRFTALLHHIYDVNRLRRAYMAIAHDAAAGIDGETWRHYGENLKENLQELSGRLARGVYRARPVRRVYIEKADGAEKTARRSGLGRQDRATQRRRGTERDLRSGLPGFFLRIPAGAEPAPCAGRAGTRNLEETCELDSRCRPSKFFRHAET